MTKRKVVHASRAVPLHKDMLQLSSIPHLSFAIQITYKDRFDPNDHGSGSNLSQRLRAG